MASSKRRKNKKLHSKRRRATSAGAAPERDREAASQVPASRQGPSELDQIKAFIYGPEVGAP